MKRLRYRKLGGFAISLAKVNLKIVLAQADGSAVWQNLIWTYLDRPRVLADTAKYFSKPALSGELHKSPYSPCCVVDPINDFSRLIVLSDQGLESVLDCRLVNPSCTRADGR